MLLKYVMAFNNKRADFWFLNFGFFFHFSASLTEVFAQEECNYTQQYLLIRFISMKLNFPVLAMFSCVATQNAGFMDCMMQVQLFSLFLETEHFLVPQNIFTAGYFISTFCVF